MYEHPALLNYSEFFTKQEADGYKLHWIEIGNLSLPSGQIVAGDPFYVDDILPFSIQVKPGKYPLSLCIAQIEEDHYRVALAVIRFSDKLPEKWILAVTEGTEEEELRELAEDEFLGYPVDAGLSSFQDVVVCQKFNKAMNEFFEKYPDGNYYNDVLADEFAALSGKHPNSREIGDWNIHYPTNNPDENIIMFSSGWGDGMYPCYWGLDKNKQPLALITDFFIFGALGE